MPLFGLKGGFVLQIHTQTHPATLPHMTQVHTTAMHRPVPAAALRRLAAASALALCLTPTWAQQKPPVPTAPITVPESAELEYEVSGKVKGFNYSATGKLNWQHDGQSYQAEQRIRAPIVGTRWQKSHGRLQNAYLEPLRFEDSSRKRRNMRFDPGAGTVTAEESGQTQSVHKGGQDRLSLYFQLASVMAAQPALREKGQRIPIWTVASNRQEPWVFEVVGTAATDLPAGKMQAIELRRIQRSASDDQKAQIWLSPEVGYLPVRIHFEDDGDAVDLRLLRHTPKAGKSAS